MFRFLSGEGKKNQINKEIKLTAAPIHTSVAIVVVVPKLLPWKKLWQHKKLFCCCARCCNGLFM